MAKKNSPILGCLFLIILALGGSVQLIQSNPLVGVLVVIGVLLLGGLVLYALRKKRCEICGNIIERKSHDWAIEGVKKRVCVHCNQSLARKKSRAAMNHYR